MALTPVMTVMVRQPKKPRVKLTNIAYGEMNKARSAIPRPVLPRPELSHVPVNERYKVVAWNVNGLRALLERRPGLLLKLWNEEKVDVLGLMEIKTSGPAAVQTNVEQQLFELLGDDVTFFWNPGQVKGYAGTLVLMRPVLKDRLLSVEFGSDTEGRVITLRFCNTCVVVAYVPNSGMHLRRLSMRLTQWDVELSNHCLELGRTAKYGVILAADMNCARRDVDIWNLEQPAILKGAGTTLEERASFKTCYIDKGLRDTFADTYPSETGCFSYWSIRAKNRPLNRGLRLDYVLTDGKAEILESFILFDYAQTGDHCPVGVTCRIPLLDL